MAGIPFNHTALAASPVLPIPVASRGHRRQVAPQAQAARPRHHQAGYQAVLQVGGRQCSAGHIKTCDDQLRRGHGYPRPLCSAPSRVW